MGQVRFAGSIHLDEYWPRAKGKGDDADTVRVFTKKIEYIPDGSVEPQDITASILKAKYISAGAVRNVTWKDGAGNLIIRTRLQGIDAPELHYGLFRADATQEYRQHFAETSVIKVYDFLFTASGNNTIDCYVTTNSVDQPGAAFDSSGRFVGDVFIQVGGQEVHLNAWLIQQGLVFPAFYNTLTKEEISILLAAVEVGKQQADSIWSYLSADITTPSNTLRFRNPEDGPIHDPGNDKGPIIIPKLFRRLVTLTGLIDIANTNAALLQYKEVLSKHPFKTAAEYLDDDSERGKVYLTSEFLSQGNSAPRYTLAHFLAGDSFTKNPEELVFTEESAKIQM